MAQACTLSLVGSPVVPPPSVMGGRPVVVSRSRLGRGLVDPPVVPWVSSALEGSVAKITLP